jgi:choloylglycine hydrolase
MKKTLLSISLGLVLFATSGDACTRVVHTFSNGDVMTGRSMDWYLRYQTDLWKFPRGIAREGLSVQNPAQWVSKYGSIVVAQTTAKQAAATDGMNEKGLVANMLYLTETQYAPRDVKKKGLASSVYVQFLLDNFATVEEAVKFIQKDTVQMIPVPIPNSKHLPTMHISLSDATGDSAVIEFLNKEVVIHHAKKYQVMTNSPTYEEQLALTAYWDTIGGHNFLPGTRNSPDRFVRASFYNKHLPKAKSYREEVAGLMSIVRNASSPFGRPDPEKPNVSTTLWRTLSDQTHKVFYFESTISPNLIWVDLKQFDFSQGSGSKVLPIPDDAEYMGKVNKFFHKEKALQFAKIPQK